MQASRLQSRFIFAGFLLVAATIGSSVWSAVTFLRLNAVIDETIRASQETIDLSAELQRSLEREDDALLLFVSGDVEHARANLVAERQRGDVGFDKLVARLQSGDENERALASELRMLIDSYRTAGDDLLNDKDLADALGQYHRLVNPQLRQAVAGCDRLREANFRSMKETGIRARDETASGTRYVSVVSVLTVIAGIAVAVWLARSVLGPIGELSGLVEAVRSGNFDRRVHQVTTDELGQLAAGFNRMADSLAEYRRSSLGELLAAKTTLEASLNALPDAVLVFAPDERLVATNPPARILLAARQSAIASNLSDFPFNDDQRAAIKAALAGDSPPLHHLNLLQTFNAVIDGTSRQFILTAMPIPEFAPSRFGAVVVLDDVTEFARLDELRSELIGVASHELKSPLTAVRMNILMLQETSSDLTNRQRELLAAAFAGCEDLGLTIEELLDVTRIEAGKLRLNQTAVDLGTLLTTCMRPLQTRFDDAGIRLVIELENGSCVVPGDPARLASVMTNVLSNALKYSPSGGAVRVKVSSGQNAQVPVKCPVQITVTDEGPGVPDDFRERVFEKFFRVEHHSSDRRDGVNGTGIGLYLCREIIRAHGGSISCGAGDDGIGTRIAISLPAIP